MQSVLIFMVICAAVFWIVKSCNYIAEYENYEVFFFETGILFLFAGMIMDCLQILLGTSIHLRYIQPLCSLGYLGCVYLILAGRLLDDPLENKPEIIFVTAYPQYSLNAWQLDASGYILKPYDEEQICHALERAICVHKNQKLIGHKNIQIFCFPGFDVFVNHSPINFKHEKSKELLALLTYYRGGWVNIDKMTFELFEEMEEKTAKNYIRTILFRLKQILQQEKIDYILESGYGKARVIPDTFYCDFYEYLNGKTELYHGEFMGEYTWAQNMGAHMWHKN